MTRAIASIREISIISAIEGADKIEVAHIGGWKVVVKKGEFQPQELVVFCEVDSWVPTALAPFLTKEGHKPKVYNAVQGERLRTVKLRGQISQGLLLPLRVVHEAMCNDETLGYSCKDSALLSHYENDYEGMDVSELLGIQRWEPPAEFRVANAKGIFPSFIPKTDQNRIQNLSKELQEWSTDGSVWDVTEKVDGSSMTVFLHNGEIGVCSRNLELKEEEGCTFWNTARSSGVVSALKEYGKNIAIQGELIGGKIQGNLYGVAEFQFLIYDIYDITSQEYLSKAFVDSLCTLFNLKQVPWVDTVTLSGATVENLLGVAEGHSTIGNRPEREGLVFCKADDSGVSFKVISNRWLLKTGK